MKFKSLSLILLVSLFSVSCSRNPVTGRKEITLVSKKQEIQMGEDSYVAFQQIYGGEYLLDPGLNSYVQDVGYRLKEVSGRKTLPYEFVIVNSCIPNAWALPGGKIAITRGLLLELDNEDELAAVLGHEIVHSAARHTAQQIERSFFLSAGLLGLSAPLKPNEQSDILVGVLSAGASLFAREYGRKAELEADKYGMIYMSKAEFDPKAALSLQEKFITLAEGEEKSWVDGLLATHPPSEERLRENKRTLLKIPEKEYFGLSRHEEKTAYINRTKPAYDKLQEGYTALSADQPELTIVKVSEALAIEPNEPHLYLLKGKALARMGKELQALYAFNKSIRLNHLYFDSYLQRGILKEKTGDLKGAKKDLEMSLYLLPTAEAHHALGEIKFHSNMTKDAIEHFRIASASPTSSGKASLARLQEIHTPAYLNQSIVVSPILTSKGYLNLGVHNTGNTTLINVVINVEQLDPKGRLLYRYLIRLDKDLEPEDHLLHQTTIGPFYGKTHFEKSLVISPVYSEVDGILE